jgi:SAM-dependent methyltransferase
MLLYALTVFVSSFLLFLVQPIIAKQIVPWFGGTAGVWTACLAFFQVALLAGYAYSDAIHRLRATTQSWLHSALLVASLAMLPIVAGAQWQPVGDEEPLFRILGLLTATIGLPYFLLATTGPLMQYWFAREQSSPEVAQRAYRLFALSNFASLLGLLSYPFAIEMWVSTKVQAYAWSGVYAAYVVLALAVALRAMKSGRRFENSSARTTVPKQSGPRSKKTAAVAHEDVAAPRIADYALWFSLAGLPTVLLLSVSSHVTQNVASIPFLWVLPLALYLFTFVIAFEGRSGKGWYSRESMMLPAMVIAVFMAWGLIADNGILDIDYAIPLYLGGLFLLCLFCHGELSQAKPSTRYLTRFYLVIASGGAFGGLVVSFLGPVLLPFYWELPLAIVLVGALGAWIATARAGGPLQTVFLGGSLLSIAVSAVFLKDYVSENYFDAVDASRSFYGTLRVKERPVAGQPEPVRRLVHGVILHGLQDLNVHARREPTTYYGKGSGVGIAIQEMAAQNPRGMRVGVIGLGVGTLAAYGRPSDQYRFYEINPQVIEIAEKDFFYLKDSLADISVALGDARLVLEREPENRFDVLVIDAFSSDSIPIHLMTREAMQVYLRHLKPEGVIAFHVTNRYLNLSPVVDLIARELGYQTALVAYEPSGEAQVFGAFSDWVLVSRNERLLMSQAVREKQYQIDSIVGLTPWTDDFNNLFRVLKD